jgi:FixJ family two-component response regulator
VISEVQLPAMSGLKLLRHLKALGKNVPAILLATDPEVSLAVEVIREGALDFFEKPFVDDRIVRRVAALLSL